MASSGNSDGRSGVGPDPELNPLPGVLVNVRWNPGHEASAVRFRGLPCTVPQRVTVLGYGRLLVGENNARIVSEQEASPQPYFCPNGC